QSLTGAFEKPPAMPEDIYCSQNTGVRFYNGWRFFVRMISHVFFTEIVFYTGWRFLIAIYLWFLDPSLL
ncbi:hypothetical protein, partial [Escherichia coli]|uniref:hypothetical protein n=1 Tax=Escherichia coli TaxID=562 RepID=UPI000D4AE42F